MNLINLKIAAASAFCLSSIVIGCTDDPVEPVGKVQPVEIAAEVSEGTNRFARTFFTNLLQKEKQENNLFVSPLSLHMALGMVLNGADGETEKEIAEALEMEGISMDVVNNSYQTLIDQLPLADSKVTLGLANSLWYKTGFTVESAYQSTLKESFKADVTSLPFDIAATGKINKWASDKTNGKIDNVLSQIDPDLVMILMNALYFKGDWSNKFDTKDTKDTPFQLLNKSEKSVKMMSQRKNFGYGSGQKFKLVQLPYGSGQFSMTVIVPNDGYEINEVMKEMTDAEMQSIVGGKLPVQTVQVGLPRFILKYNIELNDILSTMGIKRAFVATGEFKKMSAADNRLAVGFVKQDTYLGIDEKGTEAAAVTTVGMVTTSLPAYQEVVADKPFGLIISENTSKTILFMGRIMNPDSK